MPRFQLSLILLFTGLAGFLTSFSLLHLGVSSMWLRYPIAILIAYCAFLLLLRLWLWLQRRSLDVDFDPSGLDVNSSEAPSHGESFQFGGGGDFGGDGAGGSWGEGASSASSVSSGGSVTDGVGFDLDLEEGWLVVLAIVALIGGLVASVYIIYIAPALLAEILVDGVLVTGLYKRVKRIEQRHWLRAAVRRTLLPATLAAIFFTVAGYAMQKAVPAAHSIGEVWNHLVGS
jgi:membrane protein implicated in regulation of membrane protease activity